MEYDRHFLLLLCLIPQSRRPRTRYQTVLVIRHVAESFRHNLKTLLHKTATREFDQPVKKCWHTYMHTRTAGWTDQKHTVSAAHPVNCRRHNGTAVTARQSYHAPDLRGILE